MRENRPSGSMSGEWKRSVSHRVTPRLYFIQTRLHGSIERLGPALPGVRILGSEGNSVTRWIRDLGTPDHDEATRLLWERYFGRIAEIARRRLRSGAAGPAEGEDVALNVFDSFFRGAAAGRFEKLDGREDLWRLLVTIAARKSSNAVRDEDRRKRGGSGAECSLLVDHDILDGIAGREPTPEFAALVADESRRLFRLLPDDSLRFVVRMKLEGHSNEEVAGALDCGLRTVERKLGVFRKRWLLEAGS